MSDHRLKCPDCHRPTERAHFRRFERRCTAYDACGWRGDRTDTLKPDGEGGWA